MSNKSISGPTTLSRVTASDGVKKATSMKSNQRARIPNGFRNYPKGSMREVRKQPISKA